MSEITIHTAQSLFGHETVFLLDVRTPAEHREGHISGSVNIPLDQLEKNIEAIPRNKIIHCYCRSGNRSKKAYEILARYGFDVHSVSGGFVAWKDAGFETTSLSNRMPIMQQVFVIAGSLVLISTVLGVTLNTFWLLLAGGVSVGLLYAGLSGNCLMARILSQMPWNK